MLLLEANVTLIFSFNRKQRIAPSSRKTTPSHGCSCERLLACVLATLTMDSILVHWQWTVKVKFDCPCGSQVEPRGRFHITGPLCHSVTDFHDVQVTSFDLLQFQTQLCNPHSQSKTGVYKGILAYRKKKTQNVLMLGSIFPPGLWSENNLFYKI